MKWHWQQKQWPHFQYDKNALSDFEAQFHYQAGILLGTKKHISAPELSDLTITLLSTEALKTSEIEGEILDRSSVQASLRRNFGLSTPQRKASPAEEGISGVMTEVYRHYQTPLSHETLFKWHSIMMQGQTALKKRGKYRTHEDPMQIISGASYAPKVHFEAPPSKIVFSEMDRFIHWFNESLSLPPLTRAGIAHFYFEAIHPFEDGNGRIGRALVEKALSQSLQTPLLLALSKTIERSKKDYYKNFELFNRRLEITGWLLYFSQTILEAQKETLALVDFILYKTRLYDRLRGQLNDRQEKTLSRVFRDGPDGFKGGMSAEKYIKITGATRPTATRDLADLVQKDVFEKTGERRYTRYWVKQKDFSTACS